MPTPTSHPKGLFRVCSECGATWRTCNCPVLQAAEEKMKIIDVEPEIIEIDEDGNVTPADATVVRDSGDAHPTPTLTAEEELLRDAGIWRNRAIDAEQRLSQAFEEAAEAIEAKGLLFWVENAAVVRALAKEKPNGRHNIPPR